MSKRKKTKAAPQSRRPIADAPAPAPVVKQTATGAARNGHTSSVRRSVFVNEPGLDSFLRRTFPGAQVNDRIEDPFREDTRVYAAISLIADSMAAIPITIFQTDPSKDEDAEPIPDSDPVAKLFEHVNPMMDPSELRERSALSMETTGGVFWLMTNSDGADVTATDSTSPNSKIQLPDELWPVSQSSVEPVTNPATNLPMGWRVNMGGGKSKTYNPSSVVQFKYPKASGGLMGQAPLDVAMARAAQIFKARAYQDSILQNGGDPGGIIIAKPMSADAVARLEQTIGEDWNDGTQAGDTRLLFGDLTYQPNPIGPKDLQYETLLKVNEQAISEVFRVPPTLLGMRSANFAEHKLHLREFWSIKMLALFRRFESALNSRFFPRLADPRQAQYRAKFDTSMVEALQGELLEQTEAARELRDLGVPLNVALRLAGIDTDPVEGGDVSLVPTTLQPLEGIGSPPDAPTPPPSSPSPEKATAVAKPEPAREIEPEPAPTLAVDEREAFVRRRELDNRSQARREPSVKRITARVRKWSRKQRSAQLAHIEKLAKGRSKLAEPTQARYRGPMSQRAADALLAAQAGGSTFRAWRERNKRLSDAYPDDGDLLYRAHITKAKLTESELEKLVLAGAAAKAWEAELIAAFGDTFDKGWQDAANSIGAELNHPALLPSDPVAQKFIKGKKFKVAEGVNSTVAKKLKKEYAKIFAEHPFDGTGTLAERLRPILGPMQKGGRDVYNKLDRRARTIAQTETAQIDSHVRRESMLDAGIEEHEWITSGLGNVRDSHRALDGQVRNIKDGTFSTPNGELRRCQDPDGHPAEIINCHCTMVAVFKDD